LAYLLIELAYEILISPLSPRVVLTEDNGYLILDGFIALGYWIWANLETAGYLSDCLPVLEGSQSYFIL